MTTHDPTLVIPPWSPSDFGHPFYSFFIEFPSPPHIPHLRFWSPIFSLFYRFFMTTHDPPLVIPPWPPSDFLVIDFTPFS